MSLCSYNGSFHYTYVHERSNDARKEKSNDSTIKLFQTLHGPAAATATRQSGLPWPIGLARLSDRCTQLVVRLRSGRSTLLLLVDGRLVGLPLQLLGHHLQVRLPGDQRSVPLCISFAPVYTSVYGKTPVLRKYDRESQYSSVTLDCTCRSAPIVELRGA